MPTVRNSGGRLCGIGPRVVLLVALTIIIRVPALVHQAPIDDESVYSLVANEMVSGGRPYVDAVERKPPMLFWTYAAIVRAGGMYNWPALHAAALLWTLATMAGLFVVGWRLFDPETGMAAAALYSIFQPWGPATDQAMNGELLMNLPLAWAWAIALGRSRQGPASIRLELFGAGVLLALALLLKQPSAIVGLAVVIYLSSATYRTSRNLSLATSLKQIGLLAAGTATTLGVIAAVLASDGLLGEAFYWSVLDHDLPMVFWIHGALHTLAFFGACLPLCLGAALVIRQRRVWEGRRAERTALLAWLAVSAVGTAAGGRFYPHYYIQLVLPLSVIAAPAFARIFRGQPFSCLQPRWTIAWLTATVVVVGLFHAWTLPVQPVPTEAGRAIAAHAQPDDRIFVWGQLPRIYLDARRRPASRYITTFPLTGYIFGGAPAGVDTRSRILPNAWSNLASDFERHPPQYIADVQADRDSAYPIAAFPFLDRLVREQYHILSRTREGVVYERNATTRRSSSADE